MKTRVPFMALAAVLAAAAIAFAAAETEQKLWNRMCASCHDGKTAHEAAVLKEKYPTEEAFTEAVMSKGNRCMNILKNDPKLISKIAREIGIRKTGESR